MPGKLALEPRKQPRQRRSAATRDAIVEAATQILARDGLAGFNTNAVAARAGVSIGSLYQYFANKDALMLALIRRQQESQAQTVAEAAAAGPGKTLAETVRRMVRAAMAHHHDDSLLATAIDHEEARLPISDELDAMLGRSAVALGALLLAHRDELGNIDPVAALRTLPALVRAAVDSWANLSPPQLDRAEAEAVRAVLGYLQFSEG
jgi:AcrR family transcriptional regulator